MRQRYGIHMCMERDLNRCFRDLNHIYEFIAHIHFVLVCRECAIDDAHVCEQERDLGFASAIYKYVDVYRAYMLVVFASRIV